MLCPGSECLTELDRRLTLLDRTNLRVSRKVTGEQKARRKPSYEPPIFLTREVPGVAEGPNEIGPGPPAIQRPDSRFKGAPR